jgi:hypothetical protein
VGRRSYRFDTVVRHRTGDCQRVGKIAGAVIEAEKQVGVEVDHGVG